MKSQERALSLYIGVRIRMVRQSLGMRQAELAHNLGVSYQQLQKYENGSNRISAARLVLIARILNVPLYTFLP